MQNWEYLTATKNDGKITWVNEQTIDREAQKAAMEFLKERGNEGWELVAVSNYDNYYEWLYFKRPKS